MAVIPAHDEIDEGKQAQAGQRDAGAVRHQARRLVMCCDGTWNSPDELRDGFPAPTNVVKIAMGVAHRDDAGTPQLVYYQPGVGTRRSERLRGGAFGYGLSRNVRACYQFIVQTYEPGDQLYFFGFSRGAYTARSTVGLIHNCGILRPEHRNRLDEAYRLYRSRDPLAHPREIEAKLFRRSYSWDEIDIRFVGVWDTVGALGIPIDGLPIPSFIKRKWTFHDATLNSRVRHAYQALSIDEQRGPFKPALWQQEKHAPADQVVKQVWFAGDHCDVGGGHREPELSDIPLLWMAEHARDHGLAFNPNHFQVRGANAAVPDDEIAGDDDAAHVERRFGERLAPDALGPIHDSRKPVYRLLRRNVRTLGARDEHEKPLAVGESAASSAQRRHRKTQLDYRPKSLVEWLDAGRHVTPVPDGSGQPAARSTV